MEHLGFKIEVEGQGIEDRQSKFEDSIMPYKYCQNPYSTTTQLNLT